MTEQTIEPNIVLTCKIIHLTIIFLALIQMKVNIMQSRGREIKSQK